AEFAQARSGVAGGGIARVAPGIDVWRKNCGVARKHQKILRWDRGGGGVGAPPPPPTSTASTAITTATTAARGDQQRGQRCKHGSHQCTSRASATRPTLLSNAWCDYALQSGAVVESSTFRRQLLKAGATRVRLLRKHR